MAACRAGRRELMRRDGLKVQRGMSCRSDGAGVCMDACRGEGGWVGGDRRPRD